MKTRISVDENQMIIKPDIKYSVIGICAIVIALFMSGIVIESIVTKDFDLLWLFCAIVIILLITGGYLIKSYGKTIILDEAGVHSKLGFFKSFLPWNEIEDYGISDEGGLYSTSLLLPLKTHILYFAVQKQKDLTFGAKRLRGRMIKRKFADCNAEQLNEKVTKFCSKYTQVAPFNECIIPSTEKSGRVRQNKKKTFMKIKPDKNGIINAIVCLFVAVVVNAAMISVIIEDKHVSFSLFAIISFGVLLLVLSVYAVISAFKTLIIDKNGITSKCILIEKQIPWSEIQDFGISYINETRFDGAIYYLYFACEQLETKKNGKKKFNREVIRTFVYYDSYDEIESKVFSFCRKYTRVRPYNSK